ncbi:MAG: ABC transporter substrate-binding protein [Alphaproteobacteria bacterium]|nr:ABC transporter substrate-binding protein [Alphaproteobacteria bacterium]
MKWQNSALAAVLLAVGLAAAPQIGIAAETLKLGLSLPLSGNGSTWGLGMKWAAEAAAKQINSGGGIKADGKIYTLEVLAYDNKYNTADGTKVAQTLFSRDNVDFVVGVMGTGPTQALQAIAERRDKLIFTTAWGRNVKGPEHPLTFTQAHTSSESMPELFGYIKKEHPNAKTVALINPNDATGKAVEADARAFWSKIGMNVVMSDFFERDTTAFQSVATKIVQAKPDIVDASSGPPDIAGQIFKELRTQGWKGIQVIAAGGSAATLTKTAGEAADGTYMGLVVDFASPAATETQRRLNGEAEKVLGEPLNPVHVSTWDATMALKAGIEKANSLDPKKVADALRTVVFESSYGPAAFGGAETYGIAEQILVPVTVAAVRNGKIVELARVKPKELEERLKVKQ